VKSEKSIASDKDVMRRIQHLVRNMNLEGYLSKYTELRSLYQSVQREFLEKGLVHHNWNHVLRVLAEGVRLGEAEGANMKIVLASVLLHDIGRLRCIAGQDHHSVGAEIAPKYLKDAGFNSDEIEQIKHCVRSHGPRGTEEPRSLEAKTCYDADIFSCAVGFIGVARVFDYFMREEGIGVKQMVEIPSGRKGARKDFYTKTGETLGAKGFRKAAKFWKDLASEFAEEQRSVRKVVVEYEGD